MWIFLGILAGILLLITIVLLLPISVLIKSNQDGEFALLLKIPFKTFDLIKDGENKESSGKFKEVLGVDELNNKGAKKGEFLEVIKDKISLISGVLKQLIKLLGKCTVKTLKINIVCAEKDAAKTAINYGLCYAVISPLINFLHGSMKVNGKGEKINIFSDFDGSESSFDFEIIITVKVLNLACAFISFIYELWYQTHTREILGQICYLR